MRLITAGSSMTAMTFIFPPQVSQVVEIEHALQTLRPGHCSVAISRRLSGAHRVTPSASGRGHLLTQMMVGREDPVIAGEVDARIGDQGRQLF